MEWLPEFYREQRLVITASLPCYPLRKTLTGRGERVFMHGSIAALKQLNMLGYGGKLELNLVYNPGGKLYPRLAERAGSRLQGTDAGTARYRFQSPRHHRHDAPIGRFREILESQGAYERYLLPATSFNPDAAGNIMCRTLVSVDWKGFLYNCDFNQAIGLPITNEEKGILNRDDLEAAAISGNELFLAQHCYCWHGRGRVELHRSTYIKSGCRLKAED